MISVLPFSFLYHFTTAHSHSLHVPHHTPYEKKIIFLFARFKEEMNRKEICNQYLSSFYYMTVISYLFLRVLFLNLYLSIYSIPLSSPFRPHLPLQAHSHTVSWIESMIWIRYINFCWCSSILFFNFSLRPEFSWM